MTIDPTVNSRVTTTGDAAAPKILVSGEGSGVIDSIRQKMHFSMTLHSKARGQPGVSFPLEYYITDGRTNVSMSTPGETSRWMKMEMPPDMWYIRSRAQQQIDLLRSAREVTCLATEDVNGVVCYMIQIVSGNTALEQKRQTVQGQVSTFGYHGLDLISPGGTLQQATLTQYVAVDTCLFVKSDQHLPVEFMPEEVSLPAGEFDCVLQDLSTTVIFPRYDEPVTIRVPQVALAALEIRWSPGFALFVAA